jgi:hypothetical protein
MQVDTITKTETVQKPKNSGNCLEETVESSQITFRFVTIMTYSPNLTLNR